MEAFIGKVTGFKRPTASASAAGKQSDWALAADLPARRGGGRHFTYGPAACWQRCWWPGWSCRGGAGCVRPRRSVSPHRRRKCTTHPLPGNRRRRRHRPSLTNSTWRSSSSHRASPGSMAAGAHPAIRRSRFAYDFYLGKYEVTQAEWEKVMGKRWKTFFSTWKHTALCFARERQRPDG